MNRINIFRNKSLKSAMLGSFLLGSFAFSHLQASDSSLIDAVFADDVARVRQLIDNGTNPNERDRFGNTALWGAQTPEMVDILCDAGVDVDAQNNRGNTVLLDTVTTGEPSIEIVEALLKHDADLDIANQEGRTPSAMVEKIIDGSKFVNGDSASESEKETYRKISKLFEQQKSWKKKLPAATPIIDAIDDGKNQEAMDLIRGGGNLDEKDLGGNTPLHLADTPEMVSLLCKNGANVNARNKDGNTPLHAAVISIASNMMTKEPVEDLQNRAIERIRILYDYNADPKIKNGKGETPLSTAQKAIKYGTVMVLGGARVSLKGEKKEAYKEVLKHLLEPLLPKAIADSDEEEMRQWIDVGINLQKKDAEGNTLLHHATTGGMIYLLIDAGLEVDAKNKQEQTPLNFALYGENFWALYDKNRNDLKMERIEALLESNASIEIADKSGHTPLSRMVKVIDPRNSAVKSMSPILLQSRTGQDLKLTLAAKVVCWKILEMFKDFHKGTVEKFYPKASTEQYLVHLKAFYPRSKYPTPSESPEDFFTTFEKYYYLYFLKQHSKLVKEFNHEVFFKQ
ncbi:MAG: ankyrin repeat domain-containing protein [Puniceicoccales bacterium]|jgi:ankyrin repeat protein|nr:ankyrin repeat domain-containing protein [Puniceicoccales bacterium]